MQQNLFATTEGNSGPQEFLRRRVAAFLVYPRGDQTTLQISFLSIFIPYFVKLFLLISTTGRKEILLVIFKLHI